MRVRTGRFEKCEISPGKNAHLHRTTAASTPPRLGHTSFALSLAHSPCLATPSMRFLFIGSRFTLHASFPHSVTLMQLRFASLAVTSLPGDLHPQVCAHAGRTKTKNPATCAGFWLGASGDQADLTLTVCLFSEPLISKETWPAASANNVWSFPMPTLVPG